MGLVYAGPLITQISSDWRRLHSRPRSRIPTLVYSDLKPPVSWYYWSKGILTLRKNYLAYYLLLRDTNESFSSVQFSSVAQSCPTLCNPMNCSMPGLSVQHQLPESTQTHVHWVGDAIQPSHPLSSPSPPALNPSQHKGLFQWVNSSHEVAKVLEFQLQHQFFHEHQDWSPLGWTGWISLQSKGLSRVFSNTTV